MPIEYLAIALRVGGADGVGVDLDGATPPSGSASHRADGVYFKVAHRRAASTSNCSKACGIARGG